MTPMLRKQPQYTRIILYLRRTSAEFGMAMLAATLVGSDWDSEMRTAFEALALPGNVERLDARG